MTPIAPPDGPSGLRIAADAVTPEQEAALVAAMEAAGLSYAAYDPGNARASHSYGWKYDYRTDGFVPCAPFPPVFAALATTAAGFSGLAAEDFAECLLNRYDPGAVIQPHLDKPVWEHVVGVSLGSGAVMEFSDGHHRCELALPPRSIYLLAGEARHRWRHALAPVPDRRWSVTFRSFSAEGLRRLRGSPAQV